MGTTVTHTACAQVWMDAGNVKKSFGKGGVNSLRAGGRNMYVYQIASQLTPYYHAVKAADKIGLLQRTFEDGSFGADTAMVDGVNVSRDLLDSVSEMLFLHKAFLYRPGGLDTLSVLDVGGGYGRLTKRWRDAWPKGKYHVTDGMAVSTYLAKKYLGHYHYGRSVVPLTEVHGFLAKTKVDLLINTHSFPEMALADVRFWLRTARTHRIKYIFIAPNGRLTSAPSLVTNSGESISALLAELGYTLVLFENFFANSLGLCWQPYRSERRPFDTANCERPDFYDARDSATSLSEASESFGNAVPYYLFQLTDLADPAPGGSGQKP